MTATLVKGRTVDKIKPKINKTFKAFLPALTEDEYKRLEENLKTEGCREPIVIWRGPDIIVDGHHRYEICDRHDIKFKVHFLDFANEEEALDWVADNQAGRRNFTPQQRSYFLGRQYRREVGARGGEQTEDRKNVAEELAKEAGVSSGTVMNAAKYSAAVERIAEFNPEARPQLLAGSVSDVTTLAKLPDKTVRIISNKLAKGQTVEEVKEHVPTAVLATVIKKPGSPKFNDAKITETIGRLARALVDRAKEYGKSKEYEACDKTLEAFEAAFVRWTKATA